MSFQASDDPLAPLPIGDRQDTLQQKSLKALRNRLPEERFLFRGERADDKGVDGTLEVKVEVRSPRADGTEQVRFLFTNCLAQAQLKSTDSPKRNQDGSVSYVIETSNLNYLLNGHSPLYFLWLAPDDEIRYAWAVDEWRRLEAETPNWREQSSVTVRFSRVLDSQAVDEIHARILREARLTRRISEALARSALSERVVVNIEPETLASSDPKKVYEWLTTSGMTIVSAGYGRQVLDWVGMLNPDAKCQSRIHLTAAYAEASLGRYHAAIAHIADTDLRRSELSSTDQRFLDYLRSASEYQTGRIDLPEYVRREEEWAKGQPGASAAEHRLEILRQERLRERDLGRRAKMLEEMRTLVSGIVAAADAAPAQKVQARIFLLGAEGDDLSVQIIESLGLIRSREAMGYPIAQACRRAAEESSSAWEQWQDAARRVVAAAMELGHPLLTADALAMRLTSVLCVLQMQRLDGIANDCPTGVPDDALHALMEEAERAMQIYRRAGSVEGETRAKLLLADLFDIAGQEAAARCLAEGALPVARAMSYARLEAHAQEHILGTTMARQFRTLLAERDRVDMDIHLANETDENLRAMARHTLTSLALPIERLPVVERECLSLRTIARERLDWCRHIQLLQHLAHQRHPSTHYCTDPPRVCHCALLGHESVIANPDPEIVIRAFKGAYCEGCAERNAKGSSRLSPPVAEPGRR